MKPVNRYLWRPFLFTTILKLWILTIVSFTPGVGFSQTTNISGTVNSYHKVLGVSSIAAKLDDVSGLSYGNTVLLIQMKGAGINTANNSSFGDTVSLNAAGNYEVATICSVSNDSVYFFNQLLNSYDPTYKVQLVKFGEYYSANVTDTVKAQSWNSATGKGGVLAIKVETDLTLNAPLFADSTGYKGGSFFLHSGTCSFLFPVGNGYAYDATSTGALNGAYKGEGVADVPANLDGARGAPANGGGGGNNHNNGGGGGANLTAGGNGGANYSTGPSACTGAYQGRGGKALSNWNNTKIFLGGGGGAGHANSTVQPYAGGNGGGIIIVIANNIIGNGYKISANGQNGRSTTYDGASGGGAGGTIIMDVANTYSGTLTIQANGGNGGNEDDDNSLGRCYGAGGGGSGGVIYFNGSLPVITTSLSGGIPGINIDPNTCGTPVPAVNGTTGSIIQNYSYQTSVTPSPGCAVALPIRIIYFNALLTANKKVKLEWDIANPDEAISFTIEKLTSLNNWVALVTVDAQANLHHYETTDLTPEAGENIYRLRVNGRDNNSIYSAQKRITLKSDDRYSIYPNPAKNKIHINGKIKAGSIIKFTDMSGRIIKEIITNGSLSSFEILLPTLSPGIYILNVDNYIEKIMILY
ncbi:MAG TPA: T9SS type A sorting domain-containing protein [Chitinophagaceae bacterium]|nr:T9SS type A sorting domain-containing protein [Chitinophagaceae bacterium]